MYNLSHVTEKFVETKREKIAFWMDIAYISRFQLENPSQRWSYQHLRQNHSVKYVAVTAVKKG